MSFFSKFASLLYRNLLILGFQLTLPQKSDTMKLLEIMRFIREKKKGEKSGEDFGKEICVTD